VSGGRSKAARLAALEDRAAPQVTREDWDGMSEEERWAYMQRLRTLSPTFAQMYAAAEQRVSAMSDAELWALRNASAEDV